MGIRFRLLENDNITERYTFPLVQSSNNPSSVYKHAAIKGFRGIGTINILGSEDEWDLTINGKINQSNYDNIIIAQDALITALAYGQPYYIQIDKNSAQSSQYTYKVKRLSGITFGGNPLKNGKGMIEYSVNLKVNAW